MFPRGFWLGLVGSIALLGLGGGWQNASRSGSPEMGMAQIVTFVGLFGFLYVLWLWDVATPGLVRAHEAGGEPGRLTRWLVPRPLRQAWLRSVIEARDRGTRKWEARNADRMSALRLAGHRPKVTATHKSMGEGSRWVAGLQCLRCDLTYPRTGDQGSVLSPDVPCPGDTQRH